MPDSSANGTSGLADRRRKIEIALSACDDDEVVTIAFRPLETNDFPVLVEWFAEPAIAQWWNQTAELSAIEFKYGPRVAGRERTSMWIAEIDGQAGGLLQCYLHTDYPQHDASVGIPAAVGIDYLVGGAHRGQGLGALVLSAFAAHAFDQHPSAATCVATPAQANTASWRALERAGFTRHGECQPPDEPIAFIYAVTRSDLGSPGPDPPR